MNASELPTFSSGRLFGPQGIGAVFEFDDLSVSLRGTKHWPERATRSIKAPELLHALPAIGRGRPLRAMAGVEKETVERDGEKFELVVNGLPFVRFPQWMFCIRCGLLRRLSKSECHAAELPVCRDPDCKGRLSPMRLMIACVHGHLQDVPWDTIFGPNTDRTCRHSTSLVLEQDEVDPSLDGVRVRCRAEGCNFEISFGHVYQAVRGGDVVCSGLQPGQETSPGCSGERAGGFKKMEVVQASDAATYFAETVSAIEVPPWAGRRNTVERRTLPSVLKLRELASQDPDGWSARPEAKRHIRDAKKRGGLRTDEEVVAWVNNLDTAGGSVVKPAPDISSPHELLRYEWPALTGDHPGEWKDFNIRRVWSRRRDTDPMLPEFDRWGLRSVTAVDRMRLVRVFTSYRRIDPDGGQSVWPDQGERVSSNPWLPAEETFPEGVFIRFEEDVISRWEDDLAGTALERFLDGSRDRLEKSKVRKWSRPFSRRYLLLHGMAHAILRSLSMDVGYEEASLAERVYAAPDDASGKPMAGILIYTLGADSEGSLGGLIRMAKPERFAAVLERARLALRWCGRDPVCGERRFSGRDGINGAACASCLILPETSCENGNLLLERRLFHEDRGGFFSPDRGAGL